MKKLTAANGFSFCGNRRPAIAHKANGALNQVEVSICSPNEPCLYKLPIVRFTNLIRLAILIDWLFSVILWLTGGRAQYFIRSITRFSFTTSVFDLAILANFRFVALIICITHIEDLAIALLDQPFNSSLLHWKRTLHFISGVICAGCVSYGIAKASITLSQYAKDSPTSTPHTNYLILIIWAPIATSVQLILVAYYPRALHKLPRFIRRIPENGYHSKADVNYRRLLMLAKPEANLIFFGIFFLLLSCAATMVAPLYFGQVVDAAQNSMDDLNQTVMMLFLVYSGGAIAGFFRAWLFALAGQKFVARLRKELFRAIMKQEMAFFDINRTGELTNRLSADTQLVQSAATVNISMVTRNLLQILGSLVFMFSLSPRLTGVLLVVVPVVSVGAVQYGSFVQKVRRKFQDTLALANASAEESFSSIRTIRSFAAEEKSCKKYAEDINESYALGKKLALASGGFEGVIGLATSCAVVIVLWYGGKLLYYHTQGEKGGISAGVLTYPAVCPVALFTWSHTISKPSHTNTTAPYFMCFPLAFLLYTIQVALSFAVLSSLYGDFMEAVGSSFRLFELVDREPEVPAQGGFRPDSVEGRLEFKNVHFTYPCRPESEVLKGISFTVEPGQSVALVGPSGGGKSTIVSLIERFYDPTSGRILLDGADLRDLDPTWLRRQIGRVEQEPMLFACSIRDNIMFGNDSAQEDDIKETAKQAYADEFIQSFNAGYDTMVGERGVRLSGGQKQRIAIARALMMNPKVLLLDEATSALDAESEHLVQHAIERAMEGRTVLVVAHRLSTVCRANVVLVVDEGEIVESGTHEELLAADGVYKRLVLHQLATGTQAIEAWPEETKENSDEDQRMTPSGSAETQLVSSYS